MLDTFERNRRHVALVATRGLQSLRDAEMWRQVEGEREGKALSVVEVKAWFKSKTNL